VGTDSLLMLTPTVAHKLSPYQTIYAYKMYDQNISISNLYNILLRAELSYLCIIIVKQAKNALLQQGHKSFTLDYVLDTLFY